MEPAYQEPRLLVIDDDKATVTLVSRALHEVGWRVSICMDPAKACEQVANERPHVVLLDIHLQFPTSGWKVLQALREQDSTRLVPVIVCSGHIRELEEKEWWLLEHRIGVLSKPFELEDLYDAVEEYKSSSVSRRRLSALRSEIETAFWPPPERERSVRSAPLAGTNQRGSAFGAGAD